MALHRRLAALASQLSRAPAAAVVPPPAEIDAMYAPLEARTDESAAALAANPQKLYGFVPVDNDAPKGLTAADIAQYNARGYTRPIRVYGAAEAAANRAYFDEMMGARDEGLLSFCLPHARL